LREQPGIRFFVQDGHQDFIGEVRPARGTLVPLASARHCLNHGESSLDKRWVRLDLDGEDVCEI